MIRFLFACCDAAGCEGFDEAEDFFLDDPDELVVVAGTIAVAVCNATGTADKGLCFNRVALPPVGTGWPAVVARVK